MAARPIAWRRWRSRDWRAASPRSASAETTAARCKDGGVWCWGHNGAGQLGNNGARTTGFSLDQWVDSHVPVAGVGADGRRQRYQRRFRAYVRAEGRRRLVLGRKQQRPARQRRHGGQCRAGGGVGDGERRQRDQRGLRAQLRGAGRPRLVLGPQRLRPARHQPARRGATRRSPCPGSPTGSPRSAPAPITYAR